MHKPEVTILQPDQYAQWDLFVDQSPQGDVFCYSWWLYAISWSKFRILAVFENGKIVAGIPMAFDSNNRVNQPPLTRTLGVLYQPQEGLSGHKQDSNRRRWLEALLEEFPLNNFMQMCCHQSFNDWLPFRWKGFKQTTRYTYIIEYKNSDRTALWRNLNRTQKDLVHRAQNHGIVVEITDDIRLLYDYVSKSYQRQGLVFKTPFNDLERLDEALKKRGNRTILKAVDPSGQVYSVLYGVHNHKFAFMSIAGSDPEYRSWGGYSLLFWEAINYFSDKVDFFNFGGSDIEPIEKHLRGYGGKLTPYFHIYNEALMSEQPGLRFHTKHLVHHSAEIVRILMNRTFRRR